MLDHKRISGILGSKVAVVAGQVALVTTADRLQVLVEVNGVWRVAIDEPRPFNKDGTSLIVSHFADASGVGNWPART